MEDENQKLFEFKYWSKYHFIALAVPIFCMITTYTQKIELEEIKENIKVFPYFFNIFISKLLSLIFVLLKKLINKVNSTDAIFKTSTTNKRRYHLRVNNKARKTKAALLIISISFLEVIFKYDGYLIRKKVNYIELKVGFILIVPFLSIFILKKNFYKHHYLAFFISFLAFILICLSSFFYGEHPENKEQIRHLLFSIPLGLSFVLIKYLSDTSFVDAFSFLFYDGILCIFIPIIILGIMSLVKGETDNFIENMKDITNLFCNDKSRFYFPFVIIFSFCYYLTNVLTIYIFTPSLMVMTDILSPFFRWIIEIGINKEYEEGNFLLIVLLKGIGFLIIIISAVIFNELLILHFCKFDKNIEANIKKRAKKELSIENEAGSLSFSREEEDEKNVNKEELDF